MSPSRRPLLALTAVFVVACAGPQVRPPRPLERLLDAVVAGPLSEGAIVGAYAVDLATGEPLYARAPDQRGLPASALKIVSTSAALRAFGPDFRFVTQVGLDGAIGGELFVGDLVIEASGDPSLGSWRWPETDADVTCDRVALALSALGVRRWQGALRVLGESAVDGVFGPGWAWDDVAYDYSASPSRFVFRENVVDLAVSRTPSITCDAVPAIRLDPLLPNVVAELRLDTYESGSLLDCVRDRGSPRLRCTWRAAPGFCPKSAALRVSVDEPAGLLAGFLARALDRAGIVHDGFSPEPLSALTTTGRVPLVTLESPPLAELVRATNKESLNLYAERLAMLVAQQRTGREGYGALQAALKAELLERGVDTRGLVLVDGSGLSRYNLATARALVQVLRTGLEGPGGPALRESLPIVGFDGTLAKRGIAAAKGRVRAKSGSMTGQRAWVGLAERPGDSIHPVVAFALLVGNVSQPSVASNEIFDRFVEALVTAP